MEIYPSGYFVFSHSNTYLHGAVPKINLNLGKGYLCSSPCLDNFNDVKQNYFSSNKEIKLELEGVGWHRVRINGIKDIRAEQGIAIGFIVSIIVYGLGLLEKILSRKKI